MEAAEARRSGIAPLGVFRAIAGCEPDEMGIGPVHAVPKLLARHGLKVDDIDLWELNEAFASQVLYCQQRLGIPMERLNVNGGAIALGHPFGVTGARLAGHVLLEGRRRGARYAVVTMWAAAWRRRIVRNVEPTPSATRSLKAPLRTGRRDSPKRFALSRRYGPAKPAPCGPGRGISFELHRRAAPRMTDMDLEFTAEETAFRDEVRAFLAAQLPAALSDKVLRGRPLTREDMAGWHAVLNRRGWLASHWPVEYGGTGWSSTQKFIFDNECALAGAPRIVPFGLSMLGPVLIKYGSEAQKRHWLPRILDGTDWWCQGYSEPGAGPTWPPSRPRRCAMATITSSTARRPGPRWATTPT